ncbi:MAG TPA: serine/threonine-protein kinase [Acidobacteriota bacterium]|nr:serine/threonine-protein kinase [Acidobacteriota bacterium]
MTDDSRHERLKEALYEAQALSGAARRRLLDRLETEDPGLAAEVRSLLAEEPLVDDAGRGITAAAGEVLRQVGARAELSSGVAREIGPYRLLEVIGSGGMGVVYRAEQREPIRREVALKVLGGGLTSGRIAQRFAAEQRALSLMDHPGIARILDAGGDETGTPYIVMELVQGVPITDYCRAARPDRATLLKLFVSVCRAVQHAHQKGIVHRDLKPSNILVVEVDGAPAAKIIDFGIARIVDPPDATRPRTLLTGEGQVLGTLEYMSPEQASGRVRDIDTRTDVYSLGAVLYEMLTGSLPYDLSGKSVPEAIGIIGRDPPRPFRQTRGGGRHLPGDLETITLKSLEKEPGRRYGGVGFLAEDIERYLRAEPIAARRPSTLYQLRTLVRRHRTAVILSGVAMAGLAVFGVSMAILYAGQVREREHAEVEAEKARLVSEFLQETFAAASPEDLGRGATVMQVLDRAIGRLDHSFRAQPSLAATLRNTLGETVRALGDPVRAESLITLSLAERSRLHGDGHRDVFASRLSLAEVAADRGDYARADSIAKDALRRRGADVTPRERREVLRVRGRSAIELDPPLAESLLTEAYDLTVRLHLGDDADIGELLTERGYSAMRSSKFERADSLLHSAVDRLTRVRGPDHPATLMARSNLATCLSWLGRTDEMLALGRDNLVRAERALGPDHPQTAIAHNNMASQLTSVERFREAEPHYRRAVATWERVYGPAHPHLSIGYANVGYVLHCDGRYEEAEAWYRKAVRTAQSSPGSLPGQFLYRNLASVALDRGDLFEAERWARRSIEPAAGIVGPYDLGAGWGALAEIHLASGRPDSAAGCAERAVAILRATAPRLQSHLPYEEVRALAMAARGERARADSILASIREPLVTGKYWFLEKRRALRRAETYYRKAGNSAEAAYYRQALARIQR